MSTDGVLRIVALNIQSGGAPRVKALTAALSGLDPDVVVLGEAYPTGHAQVVLDALRAIGPSTGSPPRATTSRSRAGSPSHRASHSMRRCSRSQAGRTASVSWRCASAASSLAAPTSPSSGPRSRSGATSSCPAPGAGSRSLRSSSATGTAVPRSSTRRARPLCRSRVREPLGDGLGGCLARPQPRGSRVHLVQPQA